MCLIEREIRKQRYSFHSLNLRQIFYSTISIYNGNGMINQIFIKIIY